MSDKKTGGAAFPLKEPLTSDSEGMTLRDYFAAKALPALLGDPEQFFNDGVRDMSRLEWIDYAETAYRIADAMLEARK